MLIIVKSALSWVRHVRLNKMGKPHVHKDLIIAWANGAEIEFKLQEETEWRSYQTLGVPNNPMWNETTSYRIKPEPKPDVVRYFGIDKEDSYSDFMLTERQLIHYSWNQYIKITFDGESGNPKSAEIVK